MQVVTPEFAKKFTCTAGSCPDTCCQGWQIIIDPDTLARYRNIEGELGEAVRAAIVPEAEPYFRFSENGKCALLDENGLCKLQKEIGEDAQCRVCRTYPRFVRQYGALREEGVSLSCPEAMRLLLEDSTPMKFVYEESRDPILPHDLDPEQFSALKQSRTLAFSLVQDRRYPIEDRLFLLLCFAEEVQYRLSVEEYDALSRVYRRFSSAFGRAAVLRRKARFSDAARYRTLRKWTVFFDGLEILSPAWHALMTDLSAFCREAALHRYYRDARKDFAAQFRGRDYEYEHILIATLFKYWLEASDDGILLPKVLQAVVGVLLLRECNLMHWLKSGSYDTQETAHRMAREWEHNEENLDAMRQAFLHSDCFKLRSIQSVI